MFCFNDWFSGLPGILGVETFLCCPDSFYYHVTFLMHLRRRTLFHLVNLITPCILLSFLSLLGFTLPVDCGEKLTLGIQLSLLLNTFCGHKLTAHNLIFHKLTRLALFILTLSSNISFINLRSFSLKHLLKIHTQFY